MQYNKPPLSLAQQIQLLENRGLLVADKNKAQHYLQHVSYYRLSAYYLPFQQVKDIFNLGTTFDDIIDLYVFDRELRLIVLDAIERIEVAVRAQMIYQLSHKYGSHFQDIAGIFQPARNFPGGKTVHVYAETQQIITKLTTAIHREVFIEHYYAKYTSPALPPSWMCLELLTIGELSRLYKALLNQRDKADVAAHFKLHQTVFTSWFHTITYVRNLCAHHSRLWNRDFAIQPDILLRPRLPWIDLTYNNNRRCYFFLCTLNYFLHTINPGGHFKQRLLDLLARHPNVPQQFMGFTQQWDQEPLWD
jgi:abortive infection bacteriophage resistance protein